MKTVTLLTVASVTVALQFYSSLSHAQLINPFPYETQQGLTQDDIDLILSKSASVNKTPKTGALTSWKDPTSGASGTISFIRHLKQQGMDCNLLHYVFAEATPQRDTSYNLKWCRIDGEWKLAD